MKYNILKSTFLIGLYCSLTGYFSFGQQQNPGDNFPVNPAPLNPVSTYPGLFNMTFGAKQNYIREITPDQPVTDVNTAHKHRQKTAYFDGLGRLIQTVEKKGHADGNDIIQPHIYDQIGRESITYLPYAKQADQSNGELDHLPKYRLEFFYPLAHGQLPYSEVKFDNSPLNVRTKELAPGRSWVGNGRGIEKDVTANADLRFTASGINPIHYVIRGSYPKYRYNTANNVIEYEGTYVPGKLFVNRMRDEDGLLIEEIKDKSGRLLMSRKFLKSTRPPFFPVMASPELFPTNYTYTFYVYDHLDRIRAVIPPGSVTPTFAVSGETNNSISTYTYNYNWSVPTTDVLNNLCYLYTYDKRGNVIERKVAGKGLESLVYDDRDRLVLMQDGNLRQEGKWQFSFYDKLDRPTVSGLVSLNENREVLQQQAIEPVSFVPVTSWRYYVLNYQNPGTPFGLYPPSIAGGDVLTYTYYDNYSFLPNSFDISKLPANAGNDATVVPSIYSDATKGLLTGSKVRVLEPNGASGSQWITTVNYYDAKGRVIQKVTNNLYGGTDYTSQVYYFQGMPFQELTTHNNPSAQPVPGASAALQHIKVDKKFRRNLGQGGNDQIWQIQQSINDGTPYNLAYYGYDHLGRVVVKQYSIANVLMEYNIRGWLNKIHVRSPEDQDVTYFREMLFYDDGFDSKFFNGKVAGIKWSNFNTDDNAKEQSYGYSYDKQDRLIHAEYRDNFDDQTKWGKISRDFSASGITYDDRGNILTMHQRGNSLNGPIDMDKLNYQYAANTDQLIRVSDNVSPGLTGHLPDFKDNANLAIEYLYDNNGNILTDFNKGGVTIEYNHLNLPKTINVTGKGYINYWYDALGNRLRKIIYDEQTQATVTWDYIDKFVYKNRVLQYIQNEEGRSRPEVVTSGNQMGATKFVYDYFIKDHLGNVRSAITAEPRSIDYYAMHEIATANSEQLIFENIAAVRADKPGSINLDDLKAVRLNAGEKDKKIGTAIMLRVMPGDKFTFATDAYYESDGEDKIKDNVSAEEIAASLLSTLAAGTVGGTPVSETTNSQIVNSMFSRAENINILKDLLDEDNHKGPEPRAALNYLFFDKEMKLIPKNSGSLSVKSISPNVFSNISIGTATATDVGFVVVYVDNRTIGKDVWFDNIQVLHYNAVVLEENHYYPFGLTLNSSAAGSSEQPLKYQHKELEKSFGLETYDFHARLYDPQLGRFNAIDPLAHKFINLSPYAGMGNNPILNIDPDGKKFVITGYLVADAFNQLQAGMNGQITLTMDGFGNVSYQANSDKKLKGYAKHLAKIIDNQSITVDLRTTSLNENSNGEFMIGGSFMGNTVTKEADGTYSVYATNDVNPTVFGKADAHTKTPGKMLMHEATEAFEGALISQKAGISAAPATAKDGQSFRGTFANAHSRATLQTPIKKTLFDNSGNVVTDNSIATKVEFSVSNGQTDKVIMTYP